MRILHRWVMTIAALFLVFTAITGTTMQGIDLGALLKHAPATDPNMESIREGLSGPPGFGVISPPDYVAQALPADSDPERMLATVEAAARKAVPEAPILYAELRMVGDRPEGIVSFGGAAPQTLVFDARAGDRIDVQTGGGNAANPLPQQRSNHDVFKSWHRGDLFGFAGVWVTLVVALGLLTLVVTGSVVYFQMAIRRRRLGRSELFWG